MVCHWTLGRNGTQNNWRPPGGHSREKTLLFSYQPQGFGRWKEIGRPATRTRPVKEVFVPRRIQVREREEKEYKKRWFTQKRGLELKILKVTIRKVRACNHVNIKRFNILVHCRVQFFLFPQNHKFLNTFLVFLIIPNRIDLPRSGDSHVTTKLVNYHTLYKDRK